MQLIKKGHLSGFINEYEEGKGGESSVWSTTYLSVQMLHIVHWDPLNLSQKSIIFLMRT